MSRARVLVFPTVFAGGVQVYYRFGLSQIATIPFQQTKCYLLWAPRPQGLKLKYQVLT